MLTTFFGSRCALSSISSPTRFLQTCLLITLLLISQAGYAQTLDKKQLAVLTAVVNGLLLADGEIFDEEATLTLNSSVDDLFRIKGTFSANFASTGQDVELCFVLNTYTVNLSINGVPQIGDNAPRLGENCYTIPVSQQLPQNILLFNGPSEFPVVIRGVSLANKNQSLLTLRTLNRSEWGEEAVRKVLRIFAFGGHATDIQIRIWASMRPQQAIWEMLNFQKHNARLSPLLPGERYPLTAVRYGEFKDFVTNFLSNPASNLPISQNAREKYAPDEYSFDDTLSYMVTVRGLNPFRQMVGFWETNYHLAVNLDSRVDNQDMMAFYDIIMNAHESGVPYQQVLAAAAKATAPTAQYGHHNNEWIDGTCFCNQDLAREIHQLYFGIFGEGDQEHHENVTIPNTAAMLTGMKIYDRVPDPRRAGRFINQRRYTHRLELDKHHRPALNILRQTVAGSTPLAKIDNLVEYSIQHPESLTNLPIMIVEGIADDNLNETRKNQLRAAWAAMGNNKQFLDFIHAYAISKMFHGPTQRKYMTSFWRTYNIANKYNLYNIEALQAGRDGFRFGRPINSILDNDGVQEFRPTDNVFGNQKSLDAADSSKIFEDNYNRSASENYLWSKVSCNDCDQGSAWEKDWTKVVPAIGGHYRVDDVARWLWRHMFGNLDNYTELERAHMVSILGATLNGNQSRHFDLTMMLCIYNDRVEQGETNNSVAEMIRRSTRNCRQDNNVFSGNEIRWLNKAYSTEEITNTLGAPYSGPYNPAISNGQIPRIVNELGNINMPLKSTNNDLRRNANKRIHYAIAFMSATPFITVENGE